MLEIPTLECEKLIEYLKSHEDDIADGLNDFGDLKSVYIAIFKKEPKSNYGSVSKANIEGCVCNE